MSTLVAITYPGMKDARDVLAELKDMQGENLIQLDDAVVVERRQDGAIKLHQERNLVAGGAMGGAVFGGLIGMLFLVPLLGMAVGAAAGAASGAMTDAGVDDNFARRLGRSLRPGGAALVLLVHSATPDKVLNRLGPNHHGELLQTSLSDEQERQLREAIAMAGSPRSGDTRMAAGRPAAKSAKPSNGRSARATKATKATTRAGGADQPKPTPAVVPRQKAAPRAARETRTAGS
ncbi:MAG: DUF1269 domain-containing protein [Mycobacteriales bacterium]